MILYHFIQSQNNRHRTENKWIAIKKTSRSSKFNEDDDNSQSIEISILTDRLEKPKNYNIVETDNLLKTVNEIIGNKVIQQILYYKLESKFSIVTILKTGKYVFLIKQILYIFRY